VGWSFAQILVEIIVKTALVGLRFRQGVGLWVRSHVRSDLGGNVRRMNLGRNFIASLARLLSIFSLILVLGLLELKEVRD